MVSLRVDDASLRKTLQSMDKIGRRYRTKSHLRKISRPAAQLMRSGIKSTVSGTPFKESTGNLKRSIKIMSFRRSTKLHVGPRILGKGKKYKRSFADGFYFGWIDRGFTHVRSKKRIRGRRIIDRAMRKYGDSVARKLAASFRKDLSEFI